MSDLNKEARKLSKDAYGGIKGEDYIPFIPSTVVMPESYARDDRLFNNTGYFVCYTFCSSQYLFGAWGLK